MRVTVQIEGGVAFFPGLSRPTTLDTDALAPEQAQAIEALVQQSGALAAGAASGSRAPPPGGDRRVVVLTIEVSGRTQQLRLAEPLPEALRALVAETQRLARAR